MEEHSNWLDRVCDAVERLIGDTGTKPQSADAPSSTVPAAGEAPDAPTTSGETSTAPKAQTSATQPVKPGAKVVPPDTGWQWLTKELHRLDLLLNIHLARLRARHSANPLDSFKGLAITEQEVASLLSKPIAPEGSHSVAADGPAKEPATREEVNRLGAAIESLLSAGPLNPVDWPLPRLVRLFGLSAFEKRCVVACLAPEVDRKYEKIYAFIQDDITRKKPTVDLLLNLFCSTMEEKLSARAAFQPNAPLLKFRLVQATDSTAEGPIPLLSRALKLDDRIVNYLIGASQPDNRVGAIAVLASPQLDLDQTAITDAARKQLRSLLQSVSRSTKPEDKNILFHFCGPYGSGKTTLAEACCQELRVPLLRADMRGILNGPLPAVEMARLLSREAMLQGAALVIEHFQELLADDKQSAQLPAFLDTTALAASPTFLLGNRTWKPQGLLGPRPFFELALDAPGEATRKDAWKAALAGRPASWDDAQLGALAGKFRFTRGQIHDTVIAAGHLATMRSPDAPVLTVDDLQTAARAQSDPRLDRLARKIEPRYTMADIVLPPDARAQLAELCQRVEYSCRVLGEWGFGRKLSAGKGVNALFAGPSGTGKTMAAEIIANQLGLDLYKIDLSQIVSKYIGETEKNLDAIFTAAINASCILFFDEADALFGKRSEVHDAHDRYANIEIAYLLQKMEEFEGLAILATNLRQNLDEAFVRRLAFTVQFPFPEVKERLLIWKGIWPEGLKQPAETDLAYLSNRFPLSGGGIKNVALAAAFLAAGNGGTVNLKHLLRATRREYQKMGRALTEFEGELQTIEAQSK